MSTDPSSEVAVAGDSASPSVNPPATDASAPPETAAPVAADCNAATETSGPVATSDPVATSGAATASSMGTEPEGATDTSSEPQRARPRLNPTVDLEQAKAVPTIAAPPEPPPAPAAAKDDNEPAPRPAPKQEEKVKLPEKIRSLDAELEAEIEAALAGAGSLATGEGVPSEEGAAAATPSSAPTSLPTSVPTEDDLQPGRKLTGKVLSVHGESIILDLGARASGLLQTRVYEGQPLPEVGAILKVVIERYDASEGLVHLHLPKATVSKPAGNWHEVAEDQIVDCMVVKANKGGLEVSISNLRGFLPASQVDLGFVSNLEEFVGQKLRVKITEVNQHKKNLVVSRRAFLEIARAEAREEMWKKLAVGQTHTGTVWTLKDYGAFVDIGGVDGLLHVGEISWGRVNHPKDVLSEGQQVEVQILSIDQDKQKVSLGMRQLQKSPWQDIAERFPIGTVAHGKVTKTADFGAFVELEPGVEGLVHVSELDHRRVHRVTDVLKVGQETDVKVLGIDLDKRRISLSIKALIAKAAPEPKKTDEDLAPSGGAPYERKRKGPLKGGGTGSGGLLFGNPQG